jgi:hypothetical protein
MRKAYLVKELDEKEYLMYDGNTTSDVSYACEYDSIELAENAMSKSYDTYYTIIEVYIRKY